MGYNEQQVLEGKLAPELLQWVLEAYKTVAAFQLKCGLSSDGKMGPNTIRAAEAVRDGRPPVPEQKYLRAVYGDFTYTEAGGGRIRIDENWVHLNIVRCRLHTGKTVWLHKLVAPEFPALFRRACEESGYTPEQVQTWVPRHTLWDPNRALSLHSWGIAVDFDPQRNRMGGTDGKTKGPSLFRKHPEFVKVFTDAGWEWGGSWPRLKDDMHLQRATL